MSNYVIYIAFEDAINRAAFDMQGAGFCKNTILSCKNTGVMITLPFDLRNSYIINILP